MSTAKKERLSSMAADAQRERGKIPDTRAIDELWTDTLQRQDRKASEGVGAKPGKRSQRREQTAGQRELAERGSRVMSHQEAARYEARRPKRVAGDAKGRLAMARLKLLAMYPDWHERVKSAWDAGAREALRMGLPVMSEKFKEVQATFVERVMDQSSAAFGDWRKPPRRRSIMTGSGQKQTSDTVIIE